MIKTWRSFVTTGNPSWGTYNFPQYDGFERHIEIENDANEQIIVRSDARFDFDAHLFFDRLGELIRDLIFDMSICLNSL